MHHRKSRRFRYRSNGRNTKHRSNDGERTRIISSAFQNNRSRNNFKANQNPERLVERYNALAKEALSSGDKILSENYFQHADHFMRIIGNKILNQDTAKANINIKSKKSEESSSSNNLENQNQIIEEEKK